jgi:predicted RNA binding protein YcfA (HicA-like mRNA interferase family)
VARCLEVEVTSQAESFDEALVNLREALELYFEDQPFPESVEAPIIIPASRSQSRRRHPCVSPKAHVKLRNESPVVSARQTIRAPEKGGFAEVSRKGSHVERRNESGRTVIVPDHRELARGRPPFCARRVIAVD